MASIKDRIAAAQARASAAQGLLSADDAQEIKDREELAKHEDLTRIAQRTVRLLALDRAADIARERFPQNAIDVIDLEDATPGGGAYVLRNPPHADVTEWQARMADTSDAASRDRLQRNFAMSAVVTYLETTADGTVRMRSLGGAVPIDGDDKRAPADLHNLWTQRVSGAATSIANKATDMAGFVAAKRKS